MRTTSAAMAVVLAAWAASPAGAQTAANAGAVQARQAHYREIGSALKAITDELKKDTPVRYILSSSANRIASALTEVQPMFPAGSGPAPGLKTKARAEIWSNKAEFERANAAAVAEAQKFTALARGGELGALRAQARAVGAACQSCHQKFRTPD